MVEMWKEQNNKESEKEVTAGLITVGKIILI
jgi:hypothetical protein